MSGLLPLTLALDPASGVALHAQIREALRAAILTRRLARGVHLPASRTMAADLGCARGTVLLALDQLVAEGYLTTRPGSGTRVAASLPDDVLPSPVAAEHAPGLASPSPVLSHRGARLVSAPSRAYLAGPGAPDAFALGRPALDAFPFETWGRLLQAEWRRGPLERPDPLGSPALRAAIAAYLGPGRGVACAAEDVIVTAGIRQSLRLLADLLLDPGEAAVVEEPGFPGIAQALSGAGLRVVPVRVDGGGLSAARAAATDARLAVVTPAHHYPLGHAMSLQNRLDLLAWAAGVGGWIVEDDYDGAYRYGGRPLAPLRALDRGGRVVYVGSLSKVLLPALGLSYLVLPRGLLAPVHQALAESRPAPAGLGQWALSRFIEDGHLAAHLRRTRRLYALRQEALVEAAARHAADVLTVMPMEGGMHLVARPGPGWPAGLDDARAAAALARAGISAVPLSAYHAGPPEPGLLLGYAAVPERAVSTAVRRMAETLRLTRPAASG